MFEKFTEPARKVVVYAQEQARALKHAVIGTEHLLLGMLVAGENEPGVSTGVDILIDAQMSAEKTRDEVESRHGVVAGSNPGQHIPFTPLAKQVLTNALRQSLALGHREIEVDHLLLGLLEIPGSVSIELIGNALKTAGLTIGQFVDEIIEGINRRIAEDTRSTAAATTAAETPGVRQGAKHGAEKMLAEFAEDLVAKARKGRLDPVIGRDREMDRAIRILGRRTKSNPLLIGDPGVGKTAIVEGLAQRIASGDVPKRLAGARIYALDLGSMVAGAKFRGDFEERMRRIIKEATEDPNIILFIDEIHTLIGAGAAEGAIDASSLLKPWLARGELRVIGATTHDEYVKHFEKDAALDRRFQTIDVAEPSVDDAKQILRGVAAKFAEFHEVTYEPEALDAAVDLSVQYLPKRYLPNKAIDLIDEAASYVVNRGDESNVIVVDDIITVLEGWTGGKIRQARGAEGVQLNQLEEELGRRVVGQRQGLAAVARAVRRSRAGLKDPRKPTGSFIFLGPSGVGKTETAKALAELLYGSDEALITIDMSEYMEKHTVSRLLGAPPGYVGHDEGGQLTESVRRRPFSVVLFDEIEKAHPDVFNTLLQLLDEGRLTDSQGRKVDFTNTVIIMTSNLGTEAKKKTPVGFGTKTDPRSEYQRTQESMMAALRSHFRPEFLNRIDEVVVFDSFTGEELEEIVKLRLVEVIERTRQLGAELLVSDDARRWLAENGYDPVMGARPLRRLIQREIEDELAELILAGEITPGCSVVVDVDTTEEAAGRGNLRFSILDNLGDGFGVEVGAVGDVN